MHSSLTTGSGLEELFESNIKSWLTCFIEDLAAESSLLENGVAGASYGWVVDIIIIIGTFLLFAIAAAFEFTPTENE